MSLRGGQRRSNLRTSLQLSLKLFFLMTCQRVQCFQRRFRLVCGHKNVVVIKCRHHIRADATFCQRRRHGGGQPHRVQAGMHRRRAIRRRWRCLSAESPSTPPPRGTCPMATARPPPPAKPPPCKTRFPPPRGVASTPTAFWLNLFLRSIVGSFVYLLVGTEFTCILERSGIISVERGASRRWGGRSSCGGTRLYFL